jgi:uncharacterized protein YdhG (YjbR/CyaY superfamily)
LIYFEAFKNHIGLYATPSGHTHFSDALSQYKQGKGSEQFPNEQPLPHDLIAEIISFRVEENANYTKQKNSFRYGSSKMRLLQQTTSNKLNY